MRDFIILPLILIRDIFLASTDERKSYIASWFSRFHFSFSSSFFFSTNYQLSKFQRSLVPGIDTRRLVRNHFPWRGTRAALRVRSIYGKRDVVAPGAAEHGGVPASPVHGLTPLCGIDESRWTFVYVIRIAPRLMSNETIYYGHAGMLLSMLGNFVASSRMRDILLCGGENVSWKKKEEEKEEKGTKTGKSLDRELEEKQIL